MKDIAPWQESFAEGKVLLIDKPLTWTSFNVVSKVRSLIKIKKVGHAGTLDPLASGLLVICTGKFTKRINEYMGQEKEYLATFTLGATTPTFDLESQPENAKPVEGITESAVLNAFSSFTGDNMQVPPAFSAIKQGGKPVYLLARKGKEVQLEARPISIRTFELLAFRPPEIDVRIVCSTGTYIRSIANDVGGVLGCGAYLSALRRTRIGDFKVEEALSLEGFQNMVAAMRPGV